jgi:hypothetical protein
MACLLVTFPAVIYEFLVAHFGDPDGAKRLVLGFQSLILLFSIYISHSISYFRVQERFILL